MALEFVNNSAAVCSCNKIPTGEVDECQRNMSYINSLFKFVHSLIIISCDYALDKNLPRM